MRRVRGGGKIEGRGWRGGGKGNGKREGEDGGMRGACSYYDVLLQTFVSAIEHELGSYRPSLLLVLPHGMAAVLDVSAFSASLALNPHWWRWLPLQPLPRP
ncbi:hypothetical protein Vretimale_12078 [Volvox reticuliferus]|uniref:Uncharacterized protein n=1 Tax=Volvox reticuliferus TaxID=1737510 RepID=A0A8J4GHS4_9CHLO|nr:hypothetical protein Vretimale_12078 [Volvox reticuliferus]